jgi:hypothetical protein
MRVNHVHSGLRLDDELLGATSSGPLYRRFCGAPPAVAGRAGSPAGNGRTGLQRLGIGQNPRGGVITGVAGWLARAMP